MAEVYVEADTHQAYESRSSAVSWSAVFAGALVAWGVTFIILTLGAALGFTALSPYHHNNNVTVEKFHNAAGIFTLVTAFIASGLGGYITGRLRTRWVGLHTDEVYFRDTAHGLLSWALATFLGATLVAFSANMAATNPSLTSNLSAAASNLPYSSNRTNQYSGTMQSNSMANSATPGSSSATPSSGSANSGSTDTATSGYTGTANSGYTGTAASGYSSSTNNGSAMSSTDTEAARKAGLRTSLWLTAALLMGAFAASLLATFGGSIRDRSVPTV